MSNKNYNAFGVPWFARSDTPPIRPPGAPEAPAELTATQVEKKAHRMRKLTHCRDYVKANFPPGTRFVYVQPTTMDAETFVRSPEGEEVILFSGVVNEIKLIGYTWWVRATLDEGQKRDGGSNFGLISFYYLATQYDEFMKDPPAPPP